MPTASQPGTNHVLESCWISVPCGHRSRQPSSLDVYACESAPEVLAFSIAPGCSLPEVWIPLLHMPKECAFHLRLSKTRIFNRSAVLEEWGNIGIHVVPTGPDCSPISGQLKSPGIRAPHMASHSQITAQQTNTGVNAVIRLSNGHRKPRPVFLPNETNKTCNNNWEIWIPVLHCSLNLKEECKKGTQKLNTNLYHWHMACRVSR